MRLDCFYLCADILVYVAWYRIWQVWPQAPYKLHTSSIQAPYKFCFQTCIQVVKKSSLYASCRALPRNWSVCFWVVKKSNLYASYTPPDNYYKFLAKLVSDWNTLLVAAHHSHTCIMRSRAVHHTPQPTTIIPHSPHFPPMPSKATKNWGHTPLRLGYAPPCRWWQRRQQRWWRRRLQGGDPRGARNDPALHLLGLLLSPPIAWVGAVRALPGGATRSQGMPR